MKKRITIYLDEDVLDAFKTRAEESGAGYQTMINDALQDSLERERREPKKRSLAEFLLDIPKSDTDEDLFPRIDDDATDRDVFD
ncbi:MAG: BrnA antitoxin family protein [Xanthomonadaceae bacterium]|nr:BrnA antitoxin family protein [Xanthomonadaceae bacterium]